MDEFEPDYIDTELYMSGTQENTRITEETVTVSQKIAAVVKEIIGVAIIK